MAASALGAQSLGRWLDVKPTKSNVGTSSNELGFRRSQVFGDLKLSTACEEQQQQKQQQTPWVVVARRVCPFTGKRPNRANRVSYSKHKTKRWQHVNLQRKRMWWEAGKRFLKLRLSTSAIRTIEKNGIDAVAKKAGIDLNTLQNKLQDALESLNNQERSPMVLQLESQILYRLWKMDACMQSYEKLQKIKVDSIDVKINSIATLVSAGRSNEVQGVMDALKVKASNSFELPYNTACSLIEKKKYAEAEQQLLSARRIGQEMLMEEDYADEEIETELAPISVQLAYIQQLLGRKQEAMEAYINIISRNLADAPSLVIATNNLIVLKGGAKDASDGLRKLDKLMEKKGEDGSFKLASGLDFKLSQRQKEIS